ncbi:uncharacterized protein [Aristolochia californica]|uniref:uncharacterized protein isoform X2 n=1 Tax=Aristolochia californica TaxID=171875 RepID=UPI0035DFA29E
MSLDGFHLCYTVVQFFNSGIDKPSGAMKLQKEIEKAKKERRKEKKREKKGDKEKSREDGVKVDKNRSSEKRHKEEGKQVKNHPDKKYEVVEQLEKSSLTVEYGQPAQVGRSLGSSDSSDSTQNSSCKRKRADPLPVLSHGTSGQGNGLRIRLPLIKLKDPKSLGSLSQIQTPSVSSGTPKLVIVPPVKDHALLPNESNYLSKENKISGSRINGPDVLVSQLIHDANQDQKLLCQSSSCSTSGRRAEVFPSHYSKDHKETIYGDASRENKISQLACSTSGRTVESLPVVAAAEDGLELHHPKEKKQKKKHRSREEKMDAKLRELFVDWCPPPLETSLPDCDDQDSWLLERKEACKEEAKGSSRVGEYVLRSAGPGGPRACLIVEADMYALPYVLPF